MGGLRLRREAVSGLLVSPPARLSHRLGGVPRAPGGSFPGHATLERGFEVDRLTDARRACPTGEGSNLYPVCGGVQVTSRRRPSSAASRATRLRLRSAHRPEET